VLNFMGNASEATGVMARATRLNPDFPLWYRFPLGASAFLMGDYEGAVAELSKIHAVDWRDYAGLWLASALGHLGKIDEAEKVWRTVGGSGTTFALHLIGVQRVMPLRDEHHMEAFLEGMRLARMPEFPQSVN